MNKTIQRLAEPNSRLYLIVMLLFSAAALVFKLYWLAAAEAVTVIILIIYALIVRRRKREQLASYIESIMYDSENARNSTLQNFPLPIAVFRFEDSGIVWGNEMFFNMTGSSGRRMDAKITDLVPEFSGKWLLEGKTQYPVLLHLGGRKYQIHGNVIHSDSDTEASGAAYMGITYWVDITEYDDIRIRYLESRPIAGVVVIDNLDELYKNQTDRVRNDVRDAAEDMLRSWTDNYNGLLRRFDRDRYLVVFEKQALDAMKAEKFSIVDQMHKVENPLGINATISIGFGQDGESYLESLQFADMAAELALSRGGDQSVIKNRNSYEFYGGRGYEVERRTKVRTRVMANTLMELINDSTRVIVMGHRYADFDCIGAAAGICCLARKNGVPAEVVIDTENRASARLIDYLKNSPDFSGTFVTKQEAIIHADSRTLLVIVDTNRPEQIEDPDLLTACNRVAVIDHHRVSATYIKNAALGFVEPYASSASELSGEMLQELLEQRDVLPAEANAMLAGIVLDTKNFTIRTGEKTFDVASFLRRCGADTSIVKKLFQNEMDDTISKYKILQCAELYRGIAIAVPKEKQNRIVAAQAADELLNISGVNASVVLAPGDSGKIFASARSIGELNVQILMEKLGGGGNRSAAAVQFSDCGLDEATDRLYKAIDDYLDM